MKLSDFTFACSFLKMCIVGLSVILLAPSSYAVPSLGTTCVGPKSQSSVVGQKLCTKVARDRNAEFNKFASVIGEEDRIVAYKKNAKKTKAIGLSNDHIDYLAQVSGGAQCYEETKGTGERFRLNFGSAFLAGSNSQIVTAGHFRVVLDQRGKKVDVRTLAKEAIVTC